MRRATAAVIGTVAGTTLLIGAKVATQPPADALASSSGAAGTGGAAGGDPGQSGDPGATGGAGAARGASASTPGASSSAVASRSTARPGATTGAPAPARTSAAVTCRSYTGKTVSPVYKTQGSVTVTISACGGVLQSASAVQNDPTDYGPNKAAITSLNSLAVRYYKTNVSAIKVAQATFTSNAYRTSLEDALTKAGIAYR